MCRGENVSIRNGNLQCGDGWFDVDGGGICSKKMGGRSCVTNGVVSFARGVVLALMLYHVECAVGFVSNTCVGLLKLLSSARGAK